MTLPENEDLNEWLAANIVDFFNEVSLLYGLCSDDAQKFSKPGEGFPPGFEYRWADGVKIVKPVCYLLWFEGSLLTRDFSDVRCVEPRLHADLSE